MQGNRTAASLTVGTCLCHADVPHRVHLDRSTWTGDCPPPRECLGQEVNELRDLTTWLDEYTTQAMATEGETSPLQNVSLSCFY
jgi:hypothetical protein